MNDIIVMKFGGSSLATTDKIKNIADIIIERSKLYKNIVVVASAMGEATDNFIKLAKEIDLNPPKREQDMLISVGERISISLLSMALLKKNKKAISFTGSQSGIITTCNHSDAKIVDVRPKRIVENLNLGKIVIVAGFQGVSSNGEITTLGRGGSDTSAVALAIALGAKKVEFYKDVLGIYEKDPKKNENVELFDKITYDNLLKILDEKTEVLHKRCITLAKKNNIKLHLLPFFNFSINEKLKGTVIEDYCETFEKSFEV